MRTDVTAADLVGALEREPTPVGPSWLDVLDASCAVVGVRRELALRVERAGGRVYLSRDLKASQARRLSWAVVRALGGYSFPAIGRVWAETDHTTILSGIRKVTEIEARFIALVVARLPIPREGVEPREARPPREGVEVREARPAVPAVDLRQIALPMCAVDPRQIEIGSVEHRSLVASRVVG